MLSTSYFLHILHHFSMVGFIFVRYVVSLGNIKGHYPYKLKYRSAAVFKLVHLHYVANQLNCSEHIDVKSACTVSHQ